MSKTEALKMLSACADVLVSLESTLEKDRVQVAIVISRYIRDCVKAIKQDVQTNTLH